MTGRSRSDDRGLSPVVGYVLLVGIVALGSIGFLVVANDAIPGGQKEAQVQKVQDAFQEIGASLDRVSYSGGSVAQTDIETFDTAGEAVRSSDAGWIRVTREDVSTGNETEIFNRSIGAIRYKNEDLDAVFSYQNGAVFKNTGNGTKLLSDPQISYSLNKSDEAPTLTLPIVTLIGSERLTGGEVVMQKVDTDPEIINESIVEGERVKLTVQSEWYVGWATFFRDLAKKTGTADAAVTVDHNNRTATLELLAPADRTSLRGIVSGTPSGNVTLSQTIDIASYNSSKCEFNGGCGATQSDGDLYVAGNLTLENKAQVNGSVYVGDTLRTDQTSNLPECTPGDPNSDYAICEDAEYENKWVNANNGGNPSKSELAKNDRNSTSTTENLPEYEPVENIVLNQIIEAGDSNDNGAEDDIDESTNTLKSSCPSGCELDAGTYYFDDLTVDQDLVLNTTNGPITLAVDGRAEFTGNIDIEVIGNNRVSLFVGANNTPGTCDLSGTGSGCDFNYDKAVQTVKNASGAVTDKSMNFWVYMRPGSEAAWQDASGGGGVFTGVLFGPGSSSSPGVDVKIGQKNTIKGTIVGNITKVKNSVSIRYDRGLRNSTIIFQGSQIPKITYLVGTEYVVEIEDDD